MMPLQDGRQQGRCGREGGHSTREALTQAYNEKDEANVPGTDGRAVNRWSGLDAERLRSG